MHRTAGKLLRPGVTTSVKYSPRAARAVAFLKSNANDIDIFVEDSTSQNMWLALLKKLLPSTVKLKNVSMLRGRASVVEACRLDQRRDGRKKLYIIDGDFDHIRGIGKPRLRYLYRLNRYCVENLLVVEDAMLDLAIESDVDLPVDEAKKKFDFTRRINQAMTALTPLFIVYATAADVSSGQRTVGLGVSELYVRRREEVEICPHKAMKRSVALARVIRNEVATDEFFSKHRKLKDRSRKLDPSMYISAKDYIMPMLYTNFQKLFGYKGTARQFRVALANRVSMDIEPNLRRRLGSLVRA